MRAWEDSAGARRSPEGAHAVTTVAVGCPSIRTGVQGECRDLILYAGGAPRNRGDYACPKRFRSRHPLPQVLLLEQAGVSRAPGSPIIRSA